MATVTYLLVLLVGLCVVHGQVKRTCDAGVSYICHGLTILEVCGGPNKGRQDCEIAGTVCTPGKANELDRPCDFPEKCTEEGRKRLPGAGLNQVKLCSVFAECIAIDNNLFELSYHECAAGYEFSATSKKCVPKEDADCSQGLYHEPCSVNKKVADTMSCDIYWLCNAVGKFVERFCMPPTPHYDPNTGTCVNNANICGTRKDVYAVTTTPPPSPCEYGQKFAVSDNCRQYDECDALLQRVRKTCAYSNYAYQILTPTTGKCVPYTADICNVRPYI